MEDRLAAVAAVVVGVAVTIVGTLEYLLPGFVPPPLEPFTTGVLVLGAGVLLVAEGVVAYAESLNHLALRAATGVGVLTLVLAVFQPDSLLFGGVFWLSLVAFGLVGAGAYRTFSRAR